MISSWVRLVVRTAVYKNLRPLGPSWVREVVQWALISWFALRFPPPDLVSDSSDETDDQTV